MWEQQYEEAGLEGDNGHARRYLLHHLLTGSVLAVWSKIEAVYALYNSWNAGTNTEGQKRFAMRIARVSIKNPLSATCLSPTSSSRATGNKLSQLSQSSQQSANKSVKSSKGGKEGSQQSSSQQQQEVKEMRTVEEEEKVNISLVGIWVPATRIGEVLKALKVQRNVQANSK